MVMQQGKWSQNAADDLYTLILAKCVAVQVINPVKEITEINKTGIKVFGLHISLHGTGELIHVFWFYNISYMNGPEKVMSLNLIKTEMVL